MTTIRKITVDMNEAQLSGDMEKYRRKALELGASNAAIVRTEQSTTVTFLPLGSPQAHAGSPFAAKCRIAGR